MRCKLTRISSDHQNLRTDEIVGYCDDAPKLEHPFRMQAKPLDPNAHIRLVDTTPVVKVARIGNSEIIVFKTQNSKYRWEPLPPIEKRP